MAHALGGLRQGAIEMTPMQEAVLDLSVEQALAPALQRVNQTFVQVMLEQGIPIEAIVCELVLSGEVERTYRLLRLEGYGAQMEHHSPTSQYGQLSRSGYFDRSVDPLSTMREIVENIRSGSFADEWDDERDAGHPGLERLKREAIPPEMLEWERDLRTQLGAGISY
jgi:ketol-acid reductoisomerase